jgi:hypothetical protein
MTRRIACFGLFTFATILTAWGSPTNYPSAVLAAGPAAYWRLNETSGTTARDSAGSNNGTIYNVTLNAAGAPPPTFAGLQSNNLPYGFNGSNAYVQTQLEINGNQGTFMALVNLNGIQASAASICIGRGAGSNVCALDMHGDGIHVQYVWANDPNTWNFNPGFAPPPGQWTFVAVSVSPSNAIMYLDSGSGLQAATNVYNHAAVSSAGPLTIGSDPGFNSRFFNGRLAEIAVFSRALTPQEISTIDQFAAIVVSTNYPAAVLQAGPAAYWRLNETSGTTAHDSAGSNDGTIYNVTLGAAGTAPPTFAGLPTNNFPYLFNGSSAYVQTPLEIGGNQGTFMAMVNLAGTEASGAAICIGRGSGSNVCALDMQGDGVNVQYVWANDPNTWNFNPGFAPLPNQWTFVAVAVSPSNAVMYMDSGNGLLAATNVYNHHTVSSAGPVTLGGDPNFSSSRYFNGRLAEIAVFNYTLTPQQIAGIDQFASVSNQSVVFNPVHYRPLPAQTLNLATNCLLLNGSNWVINPDPGADILSVPLTDLSWSPFQVPGQWMQQGLDVSESQPVAVATSFGIPESWSGQHIILRFDAIHAGTTYWLNGQELGYSENLFTPVEWDITAFAVPGQTNRLDLNMLVDTVSEGLSDSCGYAFHNLGGIDRSVRVFALPPTYIQQMQLIAGLDTNYQNGTLMLNLLLNSGQALATNLSLVITLKDPFSQPVQPSVSQQAFSSFTSTNAVVFNSQVAAPLQWNAEKPNLYQLTIELCQGTNTLESIVRNIGFRTVEVRGRLLYVNGQCVKLRGVSHHETDPLTGRADTMVHAQTDVQLLKEANVNHIRTSHYPPTSELLDAADQLGMYVEVEAPFCWVGTLPYISTYMDAVLTPTSAMVDYDHAHPCVIFWSMANESTFNEQFLASTEMVKQLDPTRPTTFNNSDDGHATDIANLHYPSYPYDDGFAGDSRPVYLGEYFFELCHSQTDVAIDPGLRETWGFGQAEPTSAFALALVPGFNEPPYALLPGLQPGGWSFIYHSDHEIGASMWASLDDTFYFSATEYAGYSFVQGYWGLLDSWRRPKPEWWFYRHIFSPVWLETRHPAFTAGQTNLQVPAENRYAFTDFSELSFYWAINGQHGQIYPSLAPGETNELVIPIPLGSQEGDTVSLQITNAAGVEVDEATIWLGSQTSATLPQPSGVPTWSDNGVKIFIQGAGFGLVFNRAIGDFDPTDPHHLSSVLSFPSVHLTQYDFGDLDPSAPPYAVFPDPTTRQFGNIQVQQLPSGLQLTVNDSYQYFTGSTTWLIDQQGRGVVSCDYTYTGVAMYTREAGIRFALNPACQTVQWRRWSEWGIFPDESISRTVGTANAQRDPALGAAVWNIPPPWPWSLDQTGQGTADFRGVKLNIYEATLSAPDGTGLTASANADAHFRAALETNDVGAYVLWQCPLAQVTLNPGDHLQGQFNVQLNGLAMQAGVTNGALVMSWPASDTGFVLQCATNLASANWTNVSTPMVTNGTTISVTVPTSGPQKFFRLSHP